MDDSEADVGEADAADVSTAKIPHSLEESCPVLSDFQLAKRGIVLSNGIPDPDNDQGAHWIGFTWMCV